MVHLVLHVLLGAQVLREPEMQRLRETAEVVKVVKAAEADAGGTEGLQQRLTEGQVLREPSGHGCSDGVCDADECWPSGGLAGWRQPGQYVAKWLDEAERLDEADPCSSMQLVPHIEHT